MSGEESPLLEVEHLTMRFGGLIAINDLSFQARSREITAIIGPNGAGKTTLFNCLTGFYHPTVGRMQLHREGEDPLLLERMETFRIAREGRVVRTFQNVRLFAGMSVVENLMVAQHAELMRASGFSLAGLVSLPGYRRAARQALERARFWVDRLGLADMADRPAGPPPSRPKRRTSCRARASHVEDKRPTRRVRAGRGAPRHRHRRTRRHDRGDHRGQWRRQDHAAQHDLRLNADKCRRNHFRRQGHYGPADA